MSESANDSWACEPWPEWREPPDPSDGGSVPAPTGPHAPTPYEQSSPFIDDASRRRENVRAAVAQATALLPLIGPGIAFLVSEPDSFPRREAAKAFNGQAWLILLMMASGAFAQFQPPWLFITYLIIVTGAGVLQALIGFLMALLGKDWTSPLTRIAQLRILPEGQPDPTRSRGKRRGA